MNFLNRTSTKIALGIILITTIVLTFITVFSIATAQSEFQRATVGFTDGNTYFVQPLPDPFEFVRRDFNQTLITNLVIAGILGVILAMGAGVIFSSLITRPLRELQTGISNLRKNKYKSKLELTGETEFDEVIDEFNEMEGELYYQEELRNNLISDVSHELKTPVTSIIAQLEGIKDKVLKIDNKRLELLKHEAQRLSELIDLLNEHTKIRSSIPNVKIEEVNLVELFDYLKNIYKKKLEKEKISLVVKLSEPSVIQGDKVLLERIFQNLIDNAIAYSKTRKITITSDEDKITIADSGIGIPKADLKKVFERFYRVEKSRSRKTGGLGLGLALVKEMVEIHGWEIVAQPNKPRGVKFVIKLK